MTSSGFTNNHNAFPSLEILVTTFITSECGIWNFSPFSLFFYINWGNSCFSSYFPACFFSTPLSIRVNLARWAGPVGVSDQDLSDRSDVTNDTTVGKAFSLQWTHHTGWENMSFSSSIQHVSSSCKAISVLVHKHECVCVVNSPLLHYKSRQDGDTQAHFSQDSSSE